MACGAPAEKQIPRSARDDSERIVLKSGRGGRSGELGEVFGEGAADFASENFCHGGNRAGRLVEGDAFDASHGKEDGGQTDALAFRFVDLTDEMVEGVEIDAAHGDAGGSDGEQLAPDFFLGRV